MAGMSSDSMHAVDWLSYSTIIASDISINTSKIFILQAKANECHLAFLQLNVTPKRISTRPSSFIFHDK